MMNLEVLSEMFYPGYYCLSAHKDGIECGKLIYEASPEQVMVISISAKPERQGTGSLLLREMTNSLANGSKINAVVIHQATLQSLRDLNLLPTSPREVIELDKSIVRDLPISRIFQAGNIVPDSTRICCDLDTQGNPFVVSWQGRVEHHGRLTTI
ncbi:MAG: hypothetical protein M1607_01780 [Patescibacteria group bacterium]|nr:hypothetical protein [Patescibacteria group bacterium]